MPETAARLPFADVEQDLVVFGVIGFMDPPRSEAIWAIADCWFASIAVKSITGDPRGNSGRQDGQLKALRMVRTSLSLPTTESLVMEMQ